MYHTYVLTIQQHMQDHLHIRRNAHPTNTNTLTTYTRTQEISIHPTTFKLHPWQIPPKINSCLSERDRKRFNSRLLSSSVNHRGRQQVTVEAFGLIIFLG